MGATSMLDGRSDLNQPLATVSLDDAQPTFKIAGMSVPPALIGTISRMQTSSVGSMLSSVGSRMRPWTTDFAAVSQFAKPGDDWSKRLQVNLTYYKGNYSAIFLVFVLYSIIANPFLLTSIVILTGAWTFLLHGRPRTEDGSLVPVSIGGRVFTGVEQKAGLGGITLLLMLVTSLGSTLFWALGASMVFVAAHAVTHKTEFHQVDGSDFGSGPPPADQV